MIIVDGVIILNNECHVNIIIPQLLHEVEHLCDLHFNKFSLVVMK